RITTILCGIKQVKKSLLRVGDGPLATKETFLHLDTGRAVRGFLAEGSLPGIPVELVSSNFVQSDASPFLQAEPQFEGSQIISTAMSLQNHRHSFGPALRIAFFLQVEAAETIEKTTGRRRVPKIGFFIVAQSLLPISMK